MDGHTSSEAMDAERPPEDRPAGFLKGKRFRLAGIIIIAFVLIVVSVRFLMDRAAYVSTADARIASDMVAVSTDISGRITSVAVGEGDRVSAGDVLFTIEDREATYTLDEYRAEADRLRAQIAREETRASLASSKAGSEVAARAAGTQSAAASVEAAQSDLETAESDYDRVKGLFDKGQVSRAALDRAQNELANAEQALRRTQAQRRMALAEQNTANIEGQEVRLIDHELAVLRATLQKAEARVDAQEVVVDQHTIRSPIDGVVDEIFYDAGEHSLRGFRMALLHNPDEVWISANIKETNIRHMHPGAPVEVHVDSHPDLDLKGRVVKINDATLAEAALMPNPNANGVFTKITQRIAVRIDLEGVDTQLRPGTMVRVRIRKQTETSRGSGAGR
ncbi:HlyD family secretion protein [Henriciella sp.]|uniref:HlyD family secretion protein n=1 Tax=Henriciella sp. TaxID=1968823 RepID=UPI002608DC8F|nr:HlyD family secretion protein [Henriciella sp.]